MKPCFQRLFVVFLAVALPLSLALEVSAQDIGQDWFSGGQVRGGAGADAIYQRNQDRPLKGLFSSDFTRTATILGGFNFPSESLNEALPAFAANGSTAALPAFSPGDVDDTGYALSFAWGRRHSRSLRSEIEVAIRGNNVNTISGLVSPATEVVDGTVTATSLMKNVLVDFESRGRFTPYAGVGIGISYIETELGEASSLDGSPLIDDGEAFFSYQAIAGVATQINSAADFIVEYRFLGTSDLEIEGIDESLSYNTSSLFLGVKFEF